jgi:ribonuclease BN (tRNA processing enzyme)
MRIIFLGTNGWYSSPTGDTPCILVDAKNQYVIFDAGSGFHKLDQYIIQEKPIALFISHFHLDHVSGLHALAKLALPQGIDVYVGEGRSVDFATLINPPFTIGYKAKSENIVNLRTEIRLHELGETGQTTPFGAVAIKQHHAYADHGFRIELDGRKIAYTGDCGFTASVKTLARDADLLICECSNKKTPQPDTWGHLDPVQAATIAKKAGVRQLILTHFAANLYTSLDDRRWAEKEAKQIFPQTVAASDGMVYQI